QILPESHAGRLRNPTDRHRTVRPERRPSTGTGVEHEGRPSPALCGRLARGSAKMSRVRRGQLHNLPVPRTRLIGREQDVAAVRQVLFNAVGCLVKLTGVGGCGKTRLALQVGADLVGAFRDGVWLVELAPVSDQALIPEVVASTLGVREQT